MEALLRTFSTAEEEKYFTAQRTFSTAEDEEIYFTESTEDIAKIQKSQGMEDALLLPSGTYRVVNSQLFRILPGVPPEERFVRSS